MTNVWAAYVDCVIDDLMSRLTEGAGESTNLKKITVNISVMDLKVLGPSAGSGLVYDAHCHFDVSYCMKL